MSSSDGGSGGGWTVPWPALAAALIALSSARLYFSSLPRSRPPATLGSAIGALGFQDAPRRLVQSPFRAAVDRGRAGGPLAWRGELDARSPPTLPGVLIAREPTIARGPGHHLA